MVKITIIVIKKVLNVILFLNRISTIILIWKRLEKALKQYFLFSKYIFIKMMIKHLFAMQMESGNKFGVYGIFWLVHTSFFVGSVWIHKWILK